jgi:hypothetical protein
MSSILPIWVALLEKQVVKEQKGGEYSRKNSENPQKLSFFA